MQHVKALDTTRPTTIAISYDVSTDLSVSTVYYLKLQRHSLIWKNDSD